MNCPCGREKCNGKLCGNFGEHGCKGVNWSIPSWSCAAQYMDENEKEHNE